MILEGGIFGYIWYRI